eukprot:jgi/Botrbrau1/236/Bobra.0022s0212.1
MGSRGSTRVAARRVLASWGNGDFGRLGHGSPCTAETRPRVVNALAGQEVVQVACGGAHTAVVAGDGTVYTMGLNDHGQLGHSYGEPFVPEPRELLLPEATTAVAAGHSHTLFLAASGNVWTVGSNSRGQLGIGTSSALEPLPRRISALSGEKVVKLAAGANHSLAVSAGGELLSWGAGDQGCLGHGAPVRGHSWDEFAPRALASLSNVGSAAASITHSGCVTQDSRCYVWGAKLRTKLLESTAFRDRPELVEGLGGVEQLTLGGGNALALALTGQAMVWGSNDNGVLGLGPDGPPNPAMPLPIPKNYFHQVAAGWKHCAAVARGGNGGSLWAWGWGGSVGSGMSLSPSQYSSGGQLGLGDEKDRWEPAKINELLWNGDVVPSGSWQAIQVSCGMNHTAAVIEILA